MWWFSINECEENRCRKPVTTHKVPLSLKSFILKKKFEKEQPRLKINCRVEGHPNNSNHVHFSTYICVVINTKNVAMAMWTQILFFVCLVLCVSGPLLTKKRCYQRSHMNGWHDRWEGTHYWCLSKATTFTTLIFITLSIMDTQFCIIWKNNNFIIIKSSEKYVNYENETISIKSTLSFVSINVCTTNSLFFYPTLIFVFVFLALKMGHASGTLFFPRVTYF